MPPKERRSTMHGDFMPAPELWILAGPNGAGKTTAVQRLPIVSTLPEVAFINPDDRTLRKLIAAGYAGFAETPSQLLDRLFLESANEVAEELKTKINFNEAVGVETVLSTDKYHSLVEWVRGRGGFFGLIYIALTAPEIAMARVANRVVQSGHGVPGDKIVQRWKRSLERLPWFAANATRFEP
ncbi:MAG TPA: hypothetical protein VGL71_14195 [Urbifossiella sp.]|jgi:predicted ABC-type ATPase